MKHKCADCGCFCRLTDVYFDDEFDGELFEAAGYDENDFDPDNEDHQRFMFVYDMWHCSQCDSYEVHTEGEKHYYNPATNNYNGEKPLTLDEQKQKRIAEAKEAARKAGQLVMFGEDLK